jgi:YD repeat-containing protein
VTTTPGIGGRTEGVAATVGGTTQSSTLYGYDSYTGQLTSAGLANAGVVADYFYDAGGLLNYIEMSTDTDHPLTTERVVDGLGRLSRITQTNGLGVVVASDVYTYDARHRRIKSTRADGNAWNYAYNDRNEVTSGGKANNTGTALAGYQYGYAYDAIGNRDNTTTNGRVAYYTANNLNQYASREVPGAIDVLGEAPTDTLVKVNGFSTSRQGTSWSATVPVTNTSGPVYQAITAKGYKADPGPAADKYRTLPTSGTGQVYLPRTPETFTYDFDGNLTSDGRWTYTWDAENRLIAVQSNANVPTAAKSRVEYSYDAGNRMIERRVLATMAAPICLPTNGV